MNNLTIVSDWLNKPHQRKFGELAFFILEWSRASTSIPLLFSFTFTKNTITKGMRHSNDAHAEKDPSHLCTLKCVNFFFINVWTERFRLTPPSWLECALFEWPLTDYRMIALYYITIGFVNQNSIGMPEHPSKNI